jgi:hypothetical protein
MGSHWPPGGASLPVFDEADARAVGWEIGRITQGEHAGSSVLQTGRCGDHFAIVLPPGARIVCRGDGSVEMENVIFTGPGPVRHDRPGCASAR